MASKNPYPHDEGYNYEFSPSKWSKRFPDPKEAVPQHIKALTDFSAAAKSDPAITHEEGIPYGEGEKQKYDIYTGTNAKAGAPIFLYIHGGYWQLLSRELSGFVARPLVEGGATVVTLGYDLAPQVDMATIVRQVRSGAQHVLNLARERGASGVYLCGHSAGAHLAAMVLSDESLQHSELIKGAVLVSGIYNIEPLCYTYVNDPIGMTKEVAEANSPVKYTDHVIKQYHGNRCHMIVAVGEYDPTSFIQQSQQYHQVLTSGGVSSEYVLLTGDDHFAAIEQLSDPQAILTQKTLKMMGLQ